MPLTAEEQRFFETGIMQEGMGNEPAPDAAPDPLQLQALSHAEPPAPAPAPAPVAAPVAAPTAAPAPAVDQTIEILTQRVAESQRQLGLMQAHIQQQQAAQQLANTPPAPDPGTDPIGSMLHQLESLQQQMNALAGHLTQTQQQALRMSQFQAFERQVETLKTDFATATPDFTPAWDYLKSARIADLKAFGMPEAQAAQQVRLEELQIAESAIMQGKNPAAVLYEMSKRHGYTPSGAPAPAPAPATAGASIEAIQRAQAAARSLPSQPAPDLTLTPEGLKQATDAELNRLVLDPKQWSKLSGEDQIPL